MELETVGRRPPWLVRPLTPVPESDADQDGGGLVGHGLEGGGGLPVEGDELLPDGLECSQTGRVPYPRAGGINHFRHERPLPIHRTRHQDLSHTAATLHLRQERGSWTIETLLSSAAVLWFMRHFVGAPILAAWDESRLRQRVESFIRDRAFHGARQSVELKAAQKPRTGSLEISQVEEESGSTPEARRLAVRVTRSTVIEVELSDREVIEEFIQELKRMQG